MTCIVGIETETCVYVAGDFQGSSEIQKSDYHNSKVFKIGDVVIGYTTSYRFGQLLEVHLTTPITPARTEDIYKWLIKTLVPEIRNILLEAKEECGDALIAVRNQLYQLSSDYSVLRSVNGFDAVGSGAHYALGCLHAQSRLDDLQGPTLTLSRALQTAHHFSPTVGAAHVVFDTLQELRA